MKTTLSEFNTFRFAPIISTANRRNLIFSGWAGFHKNTEFKARATIYHIQRFELAYNTYLEIQPGPDDQSVFNLDHPNKEIVFFEFFGAIASLLGCIDSLLQEVNCVSKLGLSPTKEDGKEEVTFGRVLGQLKSKAPGSKVIGALESLVDVNNESTAWFRFLRRLRNTVLHADVYTNSHEERDMGRIMSKIEELGTSGLIKSKEEFQKAFKRDIFFKLDDGRYHMMGLLQELAENTFNYVSHVHGLFDQE